MTSECGAAFDLATLVDYWLGGLGDREAEFEEHLFGCAACTRRLQWIGQLDVGVVSLVLSGKLFVSIPPSHLERAAAGGLRIRRYRLEPGASVACTIAPDDDANAIVLAADLVGVPRVDLAVHAVGADGAQQTERVEDLAFEAAAGEVVLLYPGDAIRPLPRCTFRLELAAVGSDGARQLGSYTLNHTPWPECP